MPMNATANRPTLTADPAAEIIGGLSDIDRDSTGAEIVEITNGGFRRWITNHGDLAFEHGYVYVLSTSTLIRTGIVCGTCADEGETHCNCNAALEA